MPPSFHSRIYSRGNMRWGRVQLILLQQGGLALCHKGIHNGQLLRQHRSQMEVCVWSAGLGLHKPWPQYTLNPKVATADCALLEQLEQWTTTIVYAEEETSSMK